MRDLIQLRYLFLRCYDVDGLLEILACCGEILGNKHNPLNNSEKESLEDLVSDVESRLQILNSNTSEKLVRSCNHPDSFNSKVFLNEEFVDRSLLPTPINIVRLHAIYKDSFHIPPSTQCYIGFESFPTYREVKFKYFSEFILPFFKDEALFEKLILLNLSLDDVKKMKTKYENFVSDFNQKEALERITIIEFEPFSPKELRKEYLRLAIDELGTDKDIISEFTGIPVQKIGELIKTHCEYKEFDGEENCESEGE